LETPQRNIVWREHENTQLGTGVIGTIYGSALAEAAVDVTHDVRKGKSTAFEDGFTLDLLDERKGHKKNNQSVSVSS
jgi:ketopantoate reductase